MSPWLIAAAAFAVGAIAGYAVGWRRRGFWADLERRALLRRSARRLRTMLTHEQIRRGQAGPAFRPEDAEDATALLERAVAEVDADLGYDTTTVGDRGDPAV